MGESEPLPPQPPPQKASLLPSFIKGITGYFWDVAGIRPAGDTMTEHALTAERKGRFLAAVTVFLIVAILFGIGLRGCYDDSEINEKNNIVQSYQQQIVGADSKVSDLQNQIGNLKSDMNEKLREKDQQISSLESKNENLNIQLTQWQTLPANVSELYSNLQKAYAESSDPTNREQISQMLDLLNSLNTTISGPENPDFDVEVNGTFLNASNVSVIRLTPDRHIFIQIPKLHEGEKPVSNLAVDFIAQLNQTNIVADTSSDHWSFPSGYSTLLGRRAIRLEMVSQGPLNTLTSFDATSFNISTNVNTPFFPAEIELYAPSLRGVENRIIVFVLL